jgi:hypothetical protein
MPLKKPGLLPAKDDYGERNRASLTAFPEFGNAMEGPAVPSLSVMAGYLITMLSLLGGWTPSTATFGAGCCTDGWIESCATFTPGEPG